MVLQISGFYLYYEQLNYIIQRIKNHIKTMVIWTF